MLSARTVPTAWKDCTGSSWDIGIRRLRVVQYEGNPKSVDSKEHATAFVTVLTPSLVEKNIFWLGLHPTPDWERCAGQTPVFLFSRSISGNWEIVQAPALEHLQSQLQRLPADQIETPQHALILFAIARLPSVSYETKLTNLIKAMQILSEKGDPTELVPEITDELVNQRADTNETHEARNNALKRFAKMRAEETVCQQRQRACATRLVFRSIDV